MSDKFLLKNLRIPLDIGEKYSILVSMSNPLPTTRDEIAPLLHRSVCKVVFVKANGTVRTMYATLMPQYLPVREAVDATAIVQQKPIKPRSDTLVTVWDVEQGGWRAFNIPAMISIEEDAAYTLKGMSL